MHVIQGRILNASTGRWWIGMELTFYSYNVKKDKVVETLGTTKTDSAGHFHFEYRCSDKRADQINMTCDIRDYDGLAYNQDVNTTIYFSSEATMKLKFTTNTPLTNDTLYLCYLYFGSPKVDTIVALPKEYVRTMKVANSEFRCFWGRGYKEFTFDNIHNDVGQYKSKSSIYPKGDPYIDSINIAY